ncbi:polymorphic toxin-type HINT domain-containing protein [Streptomyces sp. NPDC048361]|uniref:polymorphic toxin-type HINT domain-containing protein n=1 Tax=Streptomyces sp. NPDC048361 TaxID=3154720 RepID=UPI003420D976
MRLAGGAYTRIDHVKIGDKVLATDPLTGKTEPEAVTNVIITTTDKDFTDLAVATPGGPRSIKSTQHHPYWSETRYRWIDAAELHTGEALRSSEGHLQQVTAVRNYADHIATSNLTVAHLHTYYVLAGVSALLVTTPTAQT